MVTCRLQGGLGNQLFQIAAAIGYGDIHKMPVHIPHQTSHPELWPSYIHTLPRPEDPLPAGTINYIDPSYHYTAIPYYPNVCLLSDDSTQGYYQSEKYFSHCRDLVLEIFNIPYQVRIGFVSVHVRRGDYLKFPGMHPIVSELYLNTAIQFFLRTGYNKFIFFSDDLAWCRQFANLYFFNFPVHIEFSGNKTPMEDLAEMSNCEHNIIANSSFSWWAAWLNRNPRKIVIYPGLWFGPEMRFSIKDLIPKGWLKIIAA